MLAVLHLFGTYVRIQRQTSVEIHDTQVPVKPLEVISYKG